MKAKFIILTPVYNYWKNLHKLMSKINKLFLYKIKQKFDLIIVDDCSLEKINFKRSQFKSIKNFKILRNYNNLGSQRAIAIGIKYIKTKYKKDSRVVVIDSDGQDNPLGILKLIHKFEKSNSSVVAKRGQRKEALWFKMFYETYCFLIYFLTLKKIRYGNFSLIKFSDLEKILEDGNLWSAFPPTLSINLSKISTITIDRDKRYSGNSKMNFFGLFYHALRVFSVLRFRVLIFSLIYISIFYLFFQNSYAMICILFLILLNISNFILSLFNTKNFTKNFKKIRVNNFSTFQY